MSSNNSGDKFLATGHLSTGTAHFAKLLYAGQTATKGFGPTVFHGLSD